MSDSDIYVGESGARIEVRYLYDITASNGLREVDEIVTGVLHLETLDDASLYMTIDGLRVSIRAVWDEADSAWLSVTAEPDGCTRQRYG